MHWLAPEGTEMEQHHWADDGLQVFGMQIGNDGRAGDRLLILFNAGEGARAFRLAPVIGGPWHPAFDTTEATGAVPPGTAYGPDAAVPLPGRSVLVLTAAAAAGTRNGRMPVG